QLEKDGAAVLTADGRREVLEALNRVDVEIARGTRTFDLHEGTLADEGADELDEGRDEGALFGRRRRTDEDLVGRLRRGLGVEQQVLTPKLVDPRASLARGLTRG